MPERAVPQKGYLPRMKLPEFQVSFSADAVDGNNGYPFATACNAEQSAKLKTDSSRVFFFFIVCPARSRSDRIEFLAPASAGEPCASGYQLIPANQELNCPKLCFPRFEADGRPAVKVNFSIKDGSSGMCILRYFAEVAPIRIDHQLRYCDILPLPRFFETTTPTIHDTEAVSRSA